MKTLREMLEKRAGLIGQMRELTGAPAGDAGDLSAEQSTKFDNLKTELTALEKRIERQQLIDESERRMQGTPITGSGDNRLDKELRKFSIRAAVCSQVPDLASRVDCGREREISSELAKRSGMQFQGIPVPMQIFEQPVEKRVLTSTGDAGNLIATDLMGSQYIDILRARLVLRRLGARILTGLTGNIDIPKLLNSATAGWFAENAAIGSSDFQPDKISMSPKHVGALTEFSRNMLLQSSPDIETLIRDDFARILAAAVDEAGISGGGPNEPTGILATAGLDTSVSMMTPAWEAVLQLIETIELANAEGSSFLTSPNVVRKLRSTPKVSGTDSVMIMQEPTSLAGYPLASTNLMPPSSSGGANLIFGNFADVILGYWSVLDILVNPYESTAYSKGNVQVRGIVTMDMVIRHIESFAASTDVTT